METIEYCERCRKDTPHRNYGGILVSYRDCVHCHDKAFREGMKMIDRIIKRESKQSKEGE